MTTEHTDAIRNSASIAIPAPVSASNPAPIPAQDNPTATVTLHLNAERHTAHLLDIELTFTAPDSAPVLWLPTWIAGSYLIREFARHITAVTYVVQDAGNVNQGNANQDDTNQDTSHQDTANQDNAPQNQHKRAIKLSKNQWQLPEVQAGQTVTVYYEVYGYDVSVRTAYIDHTRIYANFTALALVPTGLEDAMIDICLRVPERFFSDKDHAKVQLVTGGVVEKQADVQANAQTNKQGQAHQYHWHVAGYDTLFDQPFELAEQVGFAFKVTDKYEQALPHRFYLSGRHQADLVRLKRDVRQICQSYLDWLGDAPFSEYTFMTFASGNDYGGLEHLNSTSLITPRSDLPRGREPSEPSEDYQRFLGLCSHEYFHAWWVKTVRPDVMMTSTLETEAYTPLLWVFEGFTSYIDDFMLQASGVISGDSYLKLLAGQINRYLQTQGHQWQTLAESSFDAWIKLYRPDENSTNAGVSYYNKGALVALCLDLTLLAYSEGRYRLFDVVADFYQQAKATDNNRIGMTTASLGAVVSQYLPHEVWQDFEAKYVTGLAQLPLAQLLLDNGVQVQEMARDNRLPWGIRAEETALGLKVTKVLRDSVACEAGLSAHDVIVAIDGIKADKKQLKRVASSGRAVSCHAFRRDELLTLTVPSKTLSGQSSLPSLDKVRLVKQTTGWEGWLQGLQG